MTILLVSESCVTDNAFAKQISSYLTQNAGGLTTYRSCSTQMNLSSPLTIPSPEKCSVPVAGRKKNNFRVLGRTAFVVLAISTDQQGKFSQVMLQVLFPKRERVFHRGIQTPRNK